jgi:phenylalanyl-tRNA synthetase beta chain
MGFTILPVACSFPYDTPYGREISVPFYFQEPLGCERHSCADAR